MDPYDAMMGDISACNRQQYYTRYGTIDRFPVALDSSTMDGTCCYSDSEHTGRLKARCKSHEMRTGLRLNSCCYSTMLTRVSHIDQLQQYEHTVDVLSDTQGHLLGQLQERIRSRDVQDDEVVSMLFVAPDNTVHGESGIEREKYVAFETKNPLPLRPSRHGSRVDWADVPGETIKVCTVALRTPASGCRPSTLTV